MLYCLRWCIKNPLLIAWEETRCHHYMGYSFRLAARFHLNASSHRQYSTYNSLWYTSRGALAGMRNRSIGFNPNPKNWSLEGTRWIFYQNIYLSFKDIYFKKDTTWIQECPLKHYCLFKPARCSSVVRAFAHSAMGRRIDPSWGEPIELFFVPSSAPRLV